MKKINKLNKLTDKVAAREIFFTLFLPINLSLMQPKILFNDNADQGNPASVKPQGILTTGQAVIVNAKVIENQSM